MKTKPLRPAAEIEEILRPWNIWEMSRFLQSQAIDAAVAEAAKTLDFSLQSASFAFSADPSAVADDILGRANSDAGRNLAALLAAKFVLDGCPELPSIREKLAPLFAELAAARAAEAEAARVASLKRQALRDDLAAKRAVLLAELEAEELAALESVS